MLSTEVKEEILVLLSVELERLEAHPSAVCDLLLGKCLDGLVLVFPALGIDGVTRMHLVRYYEATLRRTGSEVLIKYFEETRSSSKQSIEQFALSFEAEWVRRTGRLKEDRACPHGYHECQRCEAERH